MKNHSININEATVKAYVEKLRPASPDIRAQIDIGYSFEQNTVILFQIRPLWNDPTKKQHLEFAKVRYFKSKKLWNLYWKGGNDTWKLYKPFPSSTHLSQIIDVIKKDKHNCFYG